MKKLHLAAVALAAATLAGGAQAALTTFQSFVGNYGISSDGWGSTTQTGSMTANIPVGATIKAAYLYTSTFGFAGAGGTFNGNAVNYTSLGANNVGLEAGRADVTSIVQGVVGAVAAGGAYNFNITETSSSQDGSALVVVYELASLAKSTVGILDGFSLTTGDNTAINFSAPLDPTAPGFFAEMRLGIGFSCCSQRSSVTVNGTQITENAGNNDDSADPALSNGNLITVGGDDDAFSALNPSYADDHERYNLVPRIGLGDTSISIRTLNPSNDDNIFLALFHVLGEANFNGTPEPSALALAGLGLLGIGGLRRRRAQRA